ncbi:MAG: bifunctional hydroxymethylpyrimidine kinase/phosphomethylpyrimidine kinase [Vagococcus sp.]
MKKVLTIAGSDTLSGGGLQADLRTYYEYQVSGSNVLTCIVTVKPTTDEVTIFDLPIEWVKEDLQTCLAPNNNVSVIKIGMLANLEIAKLVAKELKKVRTIPIVVDPVLALKESGMTVKQDIIDFFLKELMPLGTITTPNVREAELLSGMESIQTVSDMKKAAHIIHQYGVKNVVIKGGQRILGSKAIDVLYDGNQWHEFYQPKIFNGFNNGAGCTFASAIAANLANEETIYESVKEAKKFVHVSIENGVPFLPELGNVWQGYSK